MYRVFKKDGKWFWDIRAGNHRTMMIGSRSHVTIESLRAEVKRVHDWAKGQHKDMDSVVYEQRDFRAC